MEVVAEFSADTRRTFDREIDGRWRPGDFRTVRLSAITPGYGRSITVHPWAKDLRSIVLRLAGEEPIHAGSSIWRVARSPVFGSTPSRCIPAKRSGSIVGWRRFHRTPTSWESSAEWMKRPARSGAPPQPR